MPVHRFLFIIVLFVLNLLTLAAILVSLGQPEPKGEPERISNQINPDRILLQSSGSDDGAASPVADRPADAAVAGGPAPVAESAPADDTAPRAGPSPAADQAPLPEAAMPTAAEVSPPADTGSPPAAGAAADSLQGAAGPEVPPPQRPGSAEPLLQDARHTPTGGDALVAPEAAAPTPKTACLLYGGLTEAQADAFEEAAGTQAGLRTERSSATGPTAWWVRLPSAGSREAAERKVRELRDQDITDLFIFRDAGPTQYAVSLGLFTTEKAARQHQAFLERKRVKGVVVSPRNGVTHSVRVRGPAEMLDALRQQLAARQAGAAPTECNR